MTVAIWRPYGTNRFPSENPGIPMRSASSQNSGAEKAALAAVTGALHHAQEFRPRSDRVAILVRHYTRDLMQMGQVMRGPRRQELV